MRLKPLRKLVLDYKGDFIADILAREPAVDHLFHYTSAEGLIGIAHSKVIWATAIQFLNDSREMLHAVDYANLATRNLAVNNIVISRTDDEVATLTGLTEYAGRIDSGIHVSSFSEERDELSQ